MDISLNNILMMKKCSQEFEIITTTTDKIIEKNSSFHVK